MANVLVIGSKQSRNTFIEASNSERLIQHELDLTLEEDDGNYEGLVNPLHYNKDLAVVCFGVDTDYRDTFRNMLQFLHTQPETQVVLLVQPDLTKFKHDHAWFLSYANKQYGKDVPIVKWTNNTTDIVDVWTEAVEKD